MSPAPPVPSLEFAFEVSAELGAIEDHGMTRAGHRRIIPAVGGTVTGALEGTILAGGADWQTVRADGSTSTPTATTSVRHARLSRQPDPSWSAPCTSRHTSVKHTTCDTTPTA